MMDCEPDKNISTWCYRKNVAKCTNKAIDQILE